MGFNISGIAINKNFEKDIESLGWNLKKESDIIFSEAIQRNEAGNLCDVYFSEKGTLLLFGLDEDDYFNPFSLEGSNVLNFVINETAMAFFLSYSENGIEKRRIMEIEGEILADEGEKLATEENSEDTGEIIWNQLGAVIGKSFWSIEENEKFVRYYFADENEENIEPKEEQKRSDISIEKIKKWWQFWK